MIFKSPWFLVLILFLPLLYRLLLHSEMISLEALKRFNAAAGTSRPGGLRIKFKIAGIFMLITALARPAWNPHPVLSGFKGRDLVIALDISRSMLAEDLYPNRLEAARFVLLEGLPGFRGQRLGLITFAGSSSVRVPLTLDHNFMKYIIERVQPADADVGSTSLQAAVEKALDIVLDDSEKGKQDLIILTDGEDHISDVDKIVSQLREWGARVLIVGLGDPVTGARVPDIGEDKKWMQYKGREVVSRLDEATLRKLADEAPGVVYFAAGTKPFEIMTLYRDLLARTADLDVGDNTRVAYDEGFQYCIGLAMVFLALSSRRRLHFALLLILMSGCSRYEDRGKSEYEKRIEEGVSAWSDAQEIVEQNPAFALDLLTRVRESFLQAAMLKPEDLPAAGFIAGVSAQMREVEKTVREQQKEEKQLQQVLEDAIALLKELTLREGGLSENARNLLRQRPPPSRLLLAGEAGKSVVEQVSIIEGTEKVHTSVTLLQNKVREMLDAAFSDDKEVSPTEFDKVAALLDEARKSQVHVSERLAVADPDWDSAGNSLLVAVRKMQEALELLSDRNGEDSSSSDSDQGDMDDWDFEEDMEWSDSSDPAARSMAIRSQNYNSALDSRNMPVPNYTADEILAEEKANSLKRSRQNESRAGAKVEKNW